VCAIIYCNAKDDQLQFECHRSFGNFFRLQLRSKILVSDLFFLQYLLAESTTACFFDTDSVHSQTRPT